MLINILCQTLSSYIHFLEPLLPVNPLKRAGHVYILKVFNLSTIQCGFCIQHLTKTILASITKFCGYFSKEIFFFNIFQSIFHTFPDFLLTILGDSLPGFFANTIFSSRKAGSLWSSFQGQPLSSHYSSTLDDASASLSSKTTC